MLAFISISTLLIMSPGADTALVTRNVLKHGRIGGFFTACGIATGLTVHALLSACGLSAILNKSPFIYESIRLAGAIYLGWLGIQSLRVAFRKSSATASESADKIEETSSELPANNDNNKIRCYLQGFFTNVLNPKVILFFLTFLPQFIGPNENVFAKSILLGAVNTAIAFSWFNTYAFLVDYLRHALGKPGMKRKIEGVTGGVLLSLGLRLALGVH